MPPHEKAGIIIVCVPNIIALSNFPIFLLLKIVN
jgi:hypothetical protein